MSNFDPFNGVEVPLDFRANPDYTDVCAVCGLRYKKFRTGLTYKEIYSQFWVQSEDTRLWSSKGRHTILGRWRELKLILWSAHLQECKG